jgi:hypothetical protein
MESSEASKPGLKIVQFLHSGAQKMNKYNKISGQVCKPDSVRPDESSRQFGMNH